MPRLAARLVSLAALIVLAVPGAAHANPTQGSIMMDDDLLLYRTAKIRDTALNQMQALGVDVIRVTVLWDYVARNARSGSNARRFRADKPGTYPAHNWDRYDSLLQAASKRKLRIYFDVTGPGPSWTREKGGSGSLARSWKPKAREFYRFVRAVGTRYSGRYRDENGGRRKLPKVRVWSLWNEPNQAGWLAPQFESSATAGGTIAQSPILYRQLYLQGRKALQDTGHGKDLIFVGETAPIGDDGTAANTPMRPGQFIREMLCLDPSGNPYTGAARSARHCDEDFKKFGSIKATAWAHHPYTKNVSPLQAPANADDITMGNAGRLADILDAASQATNGLIPKNLNIAMTEFGYETKPEDPYHGISHDLQAEYLNLGDYIAFKSPRIIGQTQFLLRDAPRRRGSGKNSYATFQSGLLTVKGAVKPAAAAYAFPFIALPSGSSYELWGQLRFRKNGSKQGLVQIQFRPHGEKDWTNVGDPFTVSHPLGYWDITQAARGAGEWRAAWIKKEGSRPALSRSVEVGS